MKTADIMIVDDNPEDLKYLRDLFHGEGYSVRTANSGEIALASVKAKAPDLVLLDIRIPEIDAYEVCRRIKADPNTQDLPIIFLSALNDKDNKVKGFKAGGSDYISKPFQTEELLARVDNYLRIYFLQQELDDKIVRIEYILAGTNAGTWEWNVQTGEEVWNEQWAKMIGYTLDELSPTSFKTFEELVHPEDFKKVQADTNNAFIKKTPIYDVEYRMRHKDGRWIWINSRGIVNSWTPDGKPLVVSGVHLDITKRKQVEEDLIQSENRYKLLFEKAPLGYQSLDFDGNIIEVNEQWLNMFGYAHEEVIGKWFGEFISPLQMEKFKKRFPVFKAQGSIYIEYEMVSKSGEKLFIGFDGKIGYDKTGAFKQTHCILKDITVEKLLENKLKESEKILLESQRIAHLGSWRIEVKTNEVFWTEEIYKMFGLDPMIPPPPYTELMKLFTPKSWDEFSTLLGKTRNYGIPYELELETVTKDGNNGWMWVRSEAKENEAGEIIEVYGVSQDITEGKNAKKELIFQNEEKDRRASELIIANKELIFQNEEKEKRASELQQSEEMMRESETKFRAIFESAPDAILLTDQNIFLDCNQKALELFGCTREQIIGQTPSRFSPKVQPDGRNTLEKTQEKNNAAITGQLQFFEWKHCRYDGTLFDAEVSLNAFTVANKIYIESLVHDITMNKRVEAELKFERDTARLYLNTMGIMLVAIDKHEKVILINREGCEILKLQEKDIIGKNWFDDFLPDSLAKDTRQLFDNIMIGNIKDYDYHENPVITGTGEKREILWHSSIMHDIEGNIIGLLSSGADITDRKRAEESLRESLQRQKKMLDGSVIAFSTAMEVRDPYTSGHQIRVSKLATAIASRLDLKQQDLETLRISGLLHDIGKMYVPAELLSKPSKLSDLEYSMIKVHSEAGYNILKSIDFEGPVAEIVYQHHERMDGSGYPRQLKGEQILKEARILCVADVVEAMMSNRPYRTALGVDAALEEIERGAGTIYDADCVKICVELFRDEGFSFSEVIIDAI